jgi:hypothetical protein
VARRRTSLTPMVVVVDSRRWRYTLTTNTHGQQHGKRDSRKASVGGFYFFALYLVSGIIVFNEWTNGREGWAARSIQHGWVGVWLEV